MPVSDLLAERRADRAEHPAVVDGDGALSYAGLGTAVDRAVGWLRAQGVTAGERVVHAGPNDRSFLALFWATLRIGAVFVPVHPELTGPQLAHIADDCTAALAICAPAAGEGLEVGADLGAAGPACRTVAPATAWQEIQRTDADGFTAEVADDAVAVLIYTSGTTGRPKGVVCPHRQMLAALHAVNSRLGYRADDVVLCRLPLSFDYGLYQALLCALTGATLVLAERASDLALLRVIEEHGVTVVPLVPSLAQILTLLRRKHPGPTAVRLFTNTGARMGRAVMSELLDAFPGAVFASMYGMTECKRISILDPAEYAAHPDSVGRPIPGLHVRIAGPDGTDLPPGRTGEIVVRGSTVMAGYWGVPLERQQRFVRRADGSLELHTGDQGRLDEDGRLYFVGRDDDMIKRRGVRLGLSEIEDAAERIPGVDAAVALRPEPEDAPLHLVVSGTLTPEEVRARLMLRLDRARMPDRISRIDTVPLTRNGKPDRAAVRQLVDPPAGPTAPAAHDKTSTTHPRTSHEPVVV
ncbi:acyl--CoA ligase [Streptomyces thermoviolaceus]|uniref:class I adenylate-forming enzyme family protein n=1 Tax=Streptomyces thermoviolaceus TaxID=1952 RepID=UPI00203B3510|nr:class I adenylate-forming enzyme family protein [Streptomyces thermoviolaceus]MCM3262891.1 acyl--CoA ligase [Streptomyces thermoviolaceus]